MALFDIPKEIQLQYNKDIQIKLPKILPILDSCLENSIKNFIKKNNKKKYSIDKEEIKKITLDIICYQLSLVNLNRRFDLTSEKIIIPYKMCVVKDDLIELPKELLLKERIVNIDNLEKALEESITTMISSQIDSCLLSL